MKKSCLMLCCLCLAGCAGGGGGEPPLTVQVQNLTSLAIVGQPVTLLVNILRGNRVATDYEGIVSFSSSLDGTVVPWPFQVLASNGGLKSFVDEFTFPESGTHTITVTAEGVPSEATLDIEVFSNPAAPPPKPPVPVPTGSKTGTLVPLDPPLTNAATVGVAVADFDQDGDVDILLGMLRGETLFFANDGKAQFTVRKAFDDGASLLRVGDLDGNGSPDVAYISGTDIKVRFNDGKGTFSAGPALPLATVATELEVGDIDGDGDLDLVVAGGGAALWINDGFGGFFDGGTVVGLIRAATLADPDADGDLDLLTNRGLFRNDGTGSFSFAGGLTFATGLAMGDIDGDRFLDAVDSESVYINDGLGKLSPTAQTFGNITGNVLLIDIDLDGDLDVLATGGENGVVSWRNDGTGVFTSFGIPDMPIQALAIVAADLDGDRISDVVVAGEDLPSVVLLHVLR